MSPPEHDTIPVCDTVECTQAYRIEALEDGLRDVIESIGRPPDPSRNTGGTGIAGTVSQIALDVRELKTRSDWPTRALKVSAAVLGVAVPMAAFIHWALSHVRISP